MGTIEIHIHETSAHLTLHNVLYAPNAGVCLVSISHLDDSGYRLSFANGLCTVIERSSGRKLTDCTRNSSNLYVLSGSIKSHFPITHSSPIISPSSPCTALHSLTPKPNLETWHVVLVTPTSELCSTWHVAMSPQVCQSICHSLLRPVTHASAENRLTVRFQKIVREGKPIGVLVVSL